MTQANENSSLHIILFISVAVVAAAALGWLFLGMDEEQPEAVSDTPVTVPGTTTAQPETDTTPAVDTEEPVDAVADGIEADLRKAQIAAAADILIEPMEQSAVFYYGRVLEADPSHPVATAELTTVLNQISVTANNHLEAGEYSEAYRIANAVAAVRPDHPMVEEVQHTLDTRATNILEDAMRLAQEGDFDSAFSAVDVAAALPGQSTDYFAAVRGTIGDLQASQQREETERQEQLEVVQRDLEQAVDDWKQKTRAAINAGMLISPAGNSARDFFAERTEVDEHQAEIRADLIDAITAQAQDDIDRQRLADAETLVQAATELGADSTVTNGLLQTIEDTHIAIESTRLIAVNNFRRITNAPARYPRRAANRGISGWVEVEFTVTTDGETVDIEITNASPENVFDDAVIEAVQQWTFEPREFRGQIIAQRTVARLVFELE